MFININCKCSNNYKLNSLSGKMIYIIVKRTATTHYKGMCSCDIYRTCDY